MTKEELREYRKLDLKIETSMDELKRWESRSERMTPTYSNDGTSSGTRNTESIIPIAVEEMEIVKENLKIDILKAANQLIKIRHAIRQLSDERYKNILDYYYLQSAKYKTWYQVGNALGYSEDWAKHLHGEALQAIKDL